MTCDGSRFEKIDIAYALFWVAIGVATCLRVGAAESVPAVVDEGSFFSPAAAQAATTAFEGLSKESGKVVRVETFARVPDAVMDRYGKEGKEAFFQHWILERMAASGANVYVLICKAPSHLRVSVSSEMMNIGFDVRKRDEVAGILLAKFKAKQYDDGLRDFTDNVVSYVRVIVEAEAGRQRLIREAASQPAPAAAPRAETVAPPTPIAETQAAPPGGPNWVILACVLICAFALVVLIVALRSKKSDDYASPTVGDGEIPPEVEEPLSSRGREDFVVSPPPVVVRRPSVPRVVYEDPPVPIIVLPLDPEPDPAPVYSAPAPDPDPPSYTPPDPDPPSSSSSDSSSSSSDSSSSSSDSGSSGGDFGSSSSSSDSGSSGGDF